MFNGMLPYMSAHPLVNGFVCAGLGFVFGWWLHKDIDRVGTEEFDAVMKDMRDNFGKTKEQPSTANNNPQDLG